MPSHPPDARPPPPATGRQAARQQPRPPPPTTLPLPTPPQAARVPVQVPALELELKLGPGLAPSSAAPCVPRRRRGVRRKLRLSTRTLSRSRTRRALVCYV